MASKKVNSHPFPLKELSRGKLSRCFLRSIIGTFSATFPTFRKIRPDSCSKHSTPRLDCIEPEMLQCNLQPNDRKTAIELTMWVRTFIFALLVTLSHTAAADSLADAIKAIDAGQPKQAAQLLMPLAAAGNTTAQYRLGMLYYMGQGVPEDEKQAIFYWKKAASQGSADAMFHLGSAYLFGNQAARTVPDPDREAATWYFQAASAGHADAQYHLGLLFLAGKGVIDSRTEAARWMRKAAAQGHPEAKKALSIIESGK